MQAVQKCSALNIRLHNLLPLLIAKTALSPQGLYIIMFLLTCSFKDNEVLAMEKVVLSGTQVRGYSEGLQLQVSWLWNLLVGLRIDFMATFRASHFYPSILAQDVAQNYCSEQAITF